MELAASTILVIATILMIVIMFASLIPFIPGSLLVWGIGLAAAFLTGFERITPIAAAIMTVLMLGGASSPYWLPFFGARGSGMSCLGAVGSIIGGLLGTFFIPIPILGTLIGLAAGTLIVEYARIGELRRAMQAGGIALRLYFVGILVDIGFSLGIILTFLISAGSTG